MQVIIVLIAAAAGYLIGSMDGALVLGKLLYKTDVRRYGSGNAGSTNVMRVFGMSMAVATLIFDLGKGVISVLLGMLLQSWVPMEQAHLLAAIAGFFSVVGHNWPAYFGFKGGKGIATTVGAALALIPLAGLGMGATILIIIAVTRYVSLASIIASILFPVFTALLYPGDTVLLLCAALLGLMAVFQHRENIDRLLHKRENKIVFQRKGLITREKG